MVTWIILVVCHRSNRVAPFGTSQAKAARHAIEKLNSNQKLTGGAGYMFKTYTYSSQLINRLFMFISNYSYGLVDSTTSLSSCLVGRQRPPAARGGARERALRGHLGVLRRGLQVGPICIMTLYVIMQYICTV